MLDNILKEIEEKFDERINAQLKIMAGLADEGHRYGYGKALEAYQQSKLLVEDIIRSHMENEPVSNPDKLGDDGWIPVQDRLPKPSEVVLVNQLYSWEHYEEGAMVTVGRLHPAENGRTPYWEFQHYRPDFRHGTIMDNDIICPGSEYVLAWRPLPEPYRPKEEK